MQSNPQVTKKQILKERQTQHFCLKITEQKLFYLKKKKTTHSTPSMKIITLLPSCI